MNVIQKPIAFPFAYLKKAERIFNGIMKIIPQGNPTPMAKHKANK